MSAADSFITRVQRHIPEAVFILHEGRPLSFKYVDRAVTLPEFHIISGVVIAEEGPLPQRPQGITDDELMDFNVTSFLGYYQELKAQMGHIPSAKCRKVFITVNTESTVLDVLVGLWMFAEDL